jgi:general secretion pathway protein G
MTLLKRRTGQRQGFTLVELMVVMVIIGILVSLITVVVVQALARAKQVQNRSDISQLEIALEQFKTRFGFYPPSRLMLCEHFSQYNNTQLAHDSVFYIQKMFPRIDTTLWTTQGIDWNNNSTLDPAVVLEGDQCLVFFMGGIPALAGGGVPPNVQGFSANPKNPADLASTQDRIGPFFEFQSSRLVYYTPPANLKPPNRNPSRATAYYYSYLDRYGASDGQGGYLSGQPYGYFSSYKAANGYNRYYPAQTYSDCSWLFANHTDGSHASLWPYVQSSTATSTVYLKPNSFQIISSGSDGVFGAGSDPLFTPLLTWTPSIASTIYYQGQNAGYDDQANFSGSLLGIGGD